ncbi:MAG: acyltransferase [Flavobacteriales bacterium]|nr:MAG: acyltransferase [Flavobacteriales bacterium]
MEIRKILEVLKELNFKTLYFNFRYLPLKYAIRLPFFISRHVYLSETLGSVTIEGPIRTRQIRIGYKAVGIFDHKRSRSVWQVAGLVIFKGHASIGHGSKISVGKTGILILGDHFKVSAESSIIATGGTVEFGSGCLLSWDILIMNSDFHKIYNNDMNLINPPDDITIGDNVWIGCRCLVLKGAEIANNNIIAAGSIVNKGSRMDSENTIYGGHPIKELRSGVSWEM